MLKVKDYQPITMGLSAEATEKKNLHLVGGGSGLEDEMIYLGVALKTVFIPTAQQLSDVYSMWNVISPVTGSMTVPGFNLMDTG